MKCYLLSGQMHKSLVDPENQAIGLNMDKFMKCDDKIYDFSYLIAIKAETIQ